MALEFLHVASLSYIVRYRAISLDIRLVIGILDIHDEHAVDQTLHATVEESPLKHSKNLSVYMTRHVSSSQRR